MLETARHRVSGLLTLSRDGYRSRITDVLNDFERDFLPLTDVTVTPLDSTRPVASHPYLAVHRAHIVYVWPEEAEESGEGGIRTLGRG